MRSLGPHLAWTRVTLVTVTVLVGLAACASTPPPAQRPAEPPREAQTEPGFELPPNVASALLLGSALLESGNVRSALEYYRFAYESMPGELELGRRLVDVALRAGRARVALTTLGELLERDPDDVELARQRAQLLAMMGAREEAVEATDDLLERDPEDRFALELRLDLLEDAGDVERALEAVDALVASDPDEAFWHVRRGDLLAANSRADEAEDAWRRALEIDATSVEAVDRLSEILREQGRTEDLVDVLEDLAGQDALGPAQRARLADLYLARGDRERTVALLLPMAERGELEPRARLIVADLLASLDRPDDAVAVLEALVEEPGDEAGLVHRTIGELYLELDETDRAIASFERAVALDPGDGSAHVGLLLALTQADPALLRADVASGARDEFDARVETAAAAVDEDSARQNFLMGAILRRTGAIGRAVPFLARAAELDPENEQVLYDLAVAQETTRDFQGARVTLEQLLVLDPDDVHLKNFYGYLLADQGWELEKAEALIRDAVAAEPDNGAYVDSLGWVLFRQGRYEEALDHLIEAVNLIGDDPVVLEHVGECLAALGRYDEALRSFERARTAGGDPDALQPRIEAMREAIGADR